MKMIMMRSSIIAALALVLFFTAMMTMAAPWTADDDHLRMVESTEPESADDWFEKLPHLKRKFTKLHIYLQDILGGDDPTVVPIAQAANVTSRSPTQFGLLTAVDDPLTEGIELGSKLVGHAEGVSFYASKEAISVIFSGSFHFTAGKYNGSTLSVLGRAGSSAPSTEFAVTGGTGYFRLAQGIAVTQVNPPDENRRVAIECKFKLVHY